MTISMERLDTIRRLAEASSGKSGSGFFQATDLNRDQWIGELAQALFETRGEMQEQQDTIDFLSEKVEDVADRIAVMTCTTGAQPFAPPGLVPALAPPVIKTLTLPAFLDAELDDNEARVRDGVLFVGAEFMRLLTSGG